MCAHFISKGFMQNGQGNYGLNERSSDWNHVQVVWEFDLIGCNNIVVSEFDSTATQLKLIRADSTPTDSNVHALVKLTMLLHQIMRHIGEKGLHAMHNKGMV
jgi:hypothetical protein